MNLAERLGYRADDRVLIIHADDVGVTHASNQAAFEAMEGGSITCASRPSIAAATLRPISASI